MKQFFEQIAKGDTSFDMETFSIEMHKEFLKVFPKGELTAEDQSNILVRLVEIMINKFGIKKEELLEGVDRCLKELNESTDELNESKDNKGYQIILCKSFIGYQEENDEGNNNISFIRSLRNDHFLPFIQSILQNYDELMKEINKSKEGLESQQFDAVVQNFINNPLIPKAIELDDVCCGVSLDRKMAESFPRSNRFFDLSSVSNEPKKKSARQAAHMLGGLPKLDSQENENSKCIVM